MVGQFADVLLKYELGVLDAAHEEAEETAHRTFEATEHGYGPSTVWRPPHLTRFSGGAARLPFRV
jgi:hypothetical protein